MIIAGRKDFDYKTSELIWIHSQQLTLKNIDLFLFYKNVFKHRKKNNQTLFCFFCFWLRAWAFDKNSPE